MKTIYKYELEITDKQSLFIPKNGVILSAQEQFNNIFIWVLVDSDNEKEERFFEVFGTGNPIYEDMGVDRSYIGTVQTHDNNLVWHIFERLN